jgi:hypothetical protein
MRSSLLVLASILSLAAGCGGQTSSIPGGGGSSGGGSGSSSSSSGGGSSGGASGGGSSGGVAPNCPMNPPSSGTGCATDGTTCEYGSSKGCGESCYCQNDTWLCAEPPCTMEICPQDPPQSGSPCQMIDSVCGYATNGGCDDEKCTCDPSGTWSCEGSGCVDASAPPDAGGPPDASDAPCPPTVPGSTKACPQPGLVCSYDNGVETNCLCAETGWVCATQ